MKHLLTDGVEQLERFAMSKVLVALDYDGTLAPICRDPAAALPRASTRALLRRVGELYDCAILSGREQADVARRLADIDLAGIVGNHGLEPWDASAALENTVREWRQRLAPLAKGGVEVEDKRYSLALHWRGAEDKRAARAAIRRAVATLGPLRAIGGKQVLNLLPADAPHKGVALDRLRAQLGREVAIYVGDDITDEDVFGLDAPWLLGVRVGTNRSSSARWYLRDQHEVDALLRALVDCGERQGVPIARERRSAR